MLIVFHSCDAAYGGDTCGVPIEVQQARDEFTLSVLNGLTSIAEVNR